MSSPQKSRAPIAFSYVVPVYNEVEDVEAAIQAAARTGRPHATCEIVVVDDASTDGTRELLREYEARGVIRLLEQPSRRWAAAARNVGTEAATGDVVVFMDADNVVPPNFIERLWEHYHLGADFVTVESCVLNQKRLVGRFQQASHQLKHGGLMNVGYSQSFSCRRDLAQRVKFQERLIGGEDGEFFSRLPLAQSRWVRDPDIVVGHRIPDTLTGLVKQFVGRGRDAVVRRHMMRRDPLWILTARKIAVLLYWLVALIAVVPAVAAGWSRTRYSSRGLRDFPGFVGLWMLQVIARRLGEWRTLLWLWRQERSQ